MFELSTSDARPDSELHRCVCGSQCRGAVRVDELKVGALTEAADSVCPECVKSLEWVFTDITETWVALHSAIGDQSRRVGQKVSGSRSAPINLNTDVDALKMAIVEWLVAAAARLAEGLNIDDPQPRNHTDAESIRIVVGCSRIILPNLDVLLGLPAEELTIWTPPGETDYPGESLPCPMSRTGYRPNTKTIEATGVDIALKIADLRHKARALLSLSSTDKLTLPCPYCNTTTLRRHHRLVYSTGGDQPEVDHVECARCGKDWPYSRYQQLCEIWVKEDEMERDKLQKQLDEVSARAKLAEWLLAERNFQFSCALDCTTATASEFAAEVLTVTVHRTTDLMSGPDIANLVGVAESTIRAWASQGRITKHIASDGSVVFQASEVWQVAKANRRNTKQSA